MNEIVLIVESDLMLIEDLRNFLALEGYETWTAIDGAQALALMEKRYLSCGLMPDCIVSVARMPTMHGIDFLDTIRAHTCWEKIPFVLMSGINDNARNWLHRPRYDAQIRKPFAMHEFAQTIWDRIRASKAKRNLA